MSGWGPSVRLLDEKGGLTLNMFYKKRVIRNTSLLSTVSFWIEKGKKILHAEDIRFRNPHAKLIKMSIFLKSSPSEKLTFKEKLGNVWKF